PQPGSLAGADTVTMQLVELTEYVIEAFAGNAQAGIPHLDAQQFTPAPAANQYPPARCIANGIAQQVAQDAAEHAVIGTHGPAPEPCPHLQTVGFDQPLEFAQQRVDDLGQGVIAQLQRDVAMIQAGNIEQVTEYVLGAFQCRVGAFNQLRLGPG